MMPHRQEESIPSNGAVAPAVLCDHVAAPRGSFGVNHSAKEGSHMLGFLFNPVSRSRLRFLGSLCFVGLTALALVRCSSSDPSAQNQAQIGVETSQFSVVVENKTGTPLVDVEVAIVPVGGATQFTKVAGRLENGEKREFALGSFFGRDGTTFSLRVVRPKTVRVTGKDLNNKTVQVDVPWK
jgi:hypothetical protein